MQSTSQTTLRPVQFGKRSHRELAQGTQLLRHPDTDLTTLPAEVRRYLDGDRSGALLAVAQWSVDNEEPKLLRSLYDAGFRGPVSLKNAQSDFLVPALLELNELPFDPLMVRLEFQHRIEPEHALQVEQLLRAHNLRIPLLRLDLSSQLTQTQASQLLSAVDLLMGLECLELLVDGAQKAPIAEHLIEPLLACQRALVLSGEVILPMLLKHWGDYQSDSELGLELKDLVDTVLVWARSPCVQSQHEVGYLLFRLAFSNGEFHLLRALATLGLAPRREGHIELFDELPEGEALDVLFQWPLWFSLQAYPQSPEALERVGQWLALRPCMKQMKLLLNSELEEAHLQRLADGVRGLGASFKRLTLWVGGTFSTVQSPELALADLEEQGQVALLRLELMKVSPAQSAAYNAAVVRLIQLIKPRRLELAVPLTSVALRCLQACGERSHFAPMELLHIQCESTDESAALTIQALQRFFEHPHQIGSFVFDGAQSQWDGREEDLVRAIPSSTPWLIDITLSQLNFRRQRDVWCSAKSMDPVRWQFWTFKPQRSDVQAAAERFFGLHLNGHFSEELSRKILRAGPLSPAERLALSRVSPQTQQALLKSRCDTLAQAVMAGQLSTDELQLLLLEPSTRQRDLRLVALLHAHFNERIEQARKNNGDSLSALEAGARFLLKEQRLWAWREDQGQDKPALGHE